MRRFSVALVVSASLFLPIESAIASDIANPSGCRFAYVSVTFDTTRNTFNHIRQYTWDFLPDGRVVEFRENPYGRTAREAGRWTMVNDQLLVISAETGTQVFGAKIGMAMRESSSQNQYYIGQALRFVGPIE